jgi:hypothetical protein
MAIGNPFPELVIVPDMCESRFKSLGSIGAITDLKSIFSKSPDNENEELTAFIVSNDASMRLFFLKTIG